MNTIQYTIRLIPPKIDAALRQQARRSGKSLNEVVVDTLAKGTGMKPDESFTDLDWFIGKGSLGDAFVDSLAWLDKAPKEIK
ncbi:MAG TPA: hypothetical protein VN778_04125 [Verrucomicrobiae bacterium]|nr:hypothetical protein [Verrucomicrobiae bacterium]